MSKLDQIKALGEARYEKRNSDVTEDVTVTKPVTPKTKTLAVACAQCQLYEAEIKRLKLELAKALPVPPKERMRQMRARKHGPQ